MVSINGKRNSPYALWNVLWRDTVASCITYEVGSLRARNKERTFAVQRLVSSVFKDWLLAASRCTPFFLQSADLIQYNTKIDLQTCYHVRIPSSSPCPESNTSPFLALSKGNVTIARDF